MSNSFYTTITRKFQCPLWPTKVRITAKYRIREDNKSAYFAYAECEIVRNLRLPKRKQNPKLDIFRYCNNDDCPCLKCFEQEITVP